jgi:hypothetical protein
MRAAQKTGIETPITDTTLTRTSGSRPWKRAETSPSGSPTISARNRPAVTNSIDAGSAVLRSDSTGRFVRYEVPQSPVAIPFK